MEYLDDKPKLEISHLYLPVEMQALSLYKQLLR